MSSTEVDVKFPEVFVINLDERVDRWKTIQATCRNCGLAPVRVSAERASPGWIGCGRSHLKVIRNAKEKRLPWVLILEDDACFDEEGITRFRALLPYLWNNRDKWERFSGGPCLRRGAEVKIFDIHRQLISIHGWSCQFDLIHSAAYDTILNWDSAKGRPLDVFYCDLADTGFRNICTYPHISTQFNSISDVDGDGTVKDVTAYFRYSSERLRECLNNAAPQAQGMLEINAVHPNWKGVLCVSQGGNFLWHKGTTSVGTYKYHDGLLVAHWYDFPEETFIQTLSGSFVHADRVDHTQKERVEKKRLDDLPGPDLGSFGNDDFLNQHALRPARVLDARLDVYPRVLVSILVKQKEKALPLFLRCIEDLDYPKSSIFLYVRTNNNTDRSEQVLREWIERVGPSYAGVEFDAAPVTDAVEQYGEHEWNQTRFRVLGNIRNISLSKTIELNCDFYFVCDVDNFIRRCTLRELVALNLPIVAPFLRTMDSRVYNCNFFCEVDENGYYRHCDQYQWIIRRWVRGVFEVPLVHCTYLIRADVIPRLRYLDGTDRYEFVVFSDSARKSGVLQYLDNRQLYGYITFDCQPDQIERAAAELAVDYVQVGSR